MKPPDKALRALLSDCEIQFVWRSSFERVSEGDHGFVCDVYGGRERFARADLIAHAPELAREVLELRREVRRLRKQVR